MKDELSNRSHATIPLFSILHEYNIASPPLLLEGEAKSKFIFTHTHICIRDIDTSRPNFSEQLLCKLLWKVDRVEEGSEITHPWLKVAPPLPFVNRNDTLLILSRRQVFHFEVVETGSRREISGGRINITKEIITKIYIYIHSMIDPLSFQAQNPDVGSISSVKQFDNHFISGELIVHALLSMSH